MDSAEIDPYAVLRASHPRLANLTKENMWHYLSAYVEAWMRNHEVERPDAIFQDPYAAALSDECGTAMINIFPQFVASEDSCSYDALRTYVFDRALEQHNPSIHQVVMLGAGMTTRAFRFPEALADCTVFEVQMNQDILEHKEEVLQRLDVKSVAKQRVVLQALLTDTSWQVALLHAGFNMKQPVFWIIESTLQFLTPEQIRRLLHGIDAMSPPHSQLVTERVGGTMDLELDEHNGIALLIDNKHRNGESGGVFCEFPWNVELLARRNQACEYYGTMWDPERLARLRVPPEECLGGPFFIPLFTKPE